MSAQLELLKRYQGWRRGDDSVMQHPAVIGEAIDYAIAIIEAAENLLSVKGRHHSEQRSRSGGRASVACTAPLHRRVRHNRRPTQTDFLEGGNMKGNNQLVLNEATMIEAVQFWLDSKMVATAPRVTQVAGPTDKYGGNNFTVSLDADADRDDPRQRTRSGAA